MADYGDTPRHKFVVGVHNPDVPSPWDYALSHGFDFACTFISRAQLQSEVLPLSPHSPEFNTALCRNALLRPSGMSLRQFEDRWLTDLDPVLHMLGLASPWLEPDSNDAFLADISATVFRVTMAYPG